MSVDAESSERSSRRQVHRDGAALPLAVIGAAGFHYVSLDLASRWLPWFYGVPLAFVAVWALQSRSDRQQGLGRQRDEVLVVALGVFLGSSLVASGSWSSIVPPFFGPSVLVQYSAVWLLPTVVGFGVLARLQRSRAMGAWTAVMAAGLLLAMALRDRDLQPSDSGLSAQALLLQLTFLSVAVAGLLRLRAGTPASPGPEHLRRAAALAADLDDPEVMPGAWS